VTNSFVLEVKKNTTISAHFLTKGFNNTSNFNVSWLYFEVLTLKPRFSRNLANALSWYGSNFTAWVTQTQKMLLSYLRSHCPYTLLMTSREHTAARVENV